MPVKTPIPNWLEPHLAMCEAIVALLRRYAEVAVHDIRRDTIVAIWNPIQRPRGRRPSLSGAAAALERAPMQGPYPKVLIDGRPVTAVSAVVPDAGGVPRGLLCVNLDRAPFEDAARLLGGLLRRRRGATA